MKNTFVLIIFFCFGAFYLNAQTSVKGYVLDEQKDPLIGANIIVEGTSTGTITDVNGNFNLSLAEGNNSLTISYTGYISQTIEVNAGNMEIILVQDANLLEQVTVSGFAGAVGQARRRAASNQRIPESVVTLTSEQIQSSGVNNVQSFSTLVPNVSFQQAQTPGVNFINVRGIAQIRNGESPIAFVIDGVTIPDANLLNQELYDLAMIEVVKGPQGTLYGKNAIGGAINILTNSPTNYNKNKVTLGYGNGNSLKAQLSSSGALSKDKVYYRISGSYKKSDGVIDNVTLGEPVDFHKDLSLRAQLKFDLSSSFSATLMGQISDTEGGATYYAHSPTGLQLDATDFNYIIDADQRGVGTLNNNFFALKLEYNLGKSIFKSVTSYNKADRDYAGDLDFLAADILRQSQQSNSKSFNQEFRLSSAANDAKMSWDIGAFYQSSDKFLYTQATADFGFFAMPAAPTGQQAVLAQLTDFNNVYNTIALFGFLDYKLSDKFTASFGLRFDNDKIEQDNRLLSTKPSKSQSELQPKVSLAYQATEQTLLYGNYGRGYRSGGFNSDATDLFDAEYEGETSNNFEVGLKTSSKDNRLVFNAAAFFVDFTNQQQYAVSIGSGGLVLGNYNFPETTVSGFEADLKYRASQYFDILAGFGFNQSEIQDGGNNGTIDRIGFVGNTTPFVPKTTFNIALQSSFPISDNLDFLGFLNLSNKGEMYWHEDNIDVADPYSLLDGRIGVSINKKFDVTIWANNIFDTDYYQEYFAGEVSGGAAGDIGWIGKPRTFGLDLSVKF